MNQTSVALRCGTLHVEVTRADMPLDELCGFGSRQSAKRGFVFVSKVLGKHYPVRPSTMAQVHARLAAKLTDLPGPVVLIAMAETATALGQGVYEACLRDTRRDDFLFLHTTRYRLDHPLALRFEEPHSHATEHLLYAGQHADLFHQARTLILVDDEITTGQTLANLAAAYRDVNRNLGQVHLVCLTDWMSGPQKDALASRIGVTLHYHSLLEGAFRPDEDARFYPGPAPDVRGNGAPKDAILPKFSGRLGVRGLLDVDLANVIQAASLERGDKVLVLGTGEFAYPPYLLALRLEELGWDVRFQSTTRSPLLVDRDIGSSLEFIDNYHDEMANYVYNLGGQRYDKILIGYETRPLPIAHGLPETLEALPIYLEAQDENRLVSRPGRHDFPDPGQVS